MRPVLRTLPYTVRGTPVTMECTIRAAYSPLRSISKGSPAASLRFSSAYISRFSSLRRTYSPTGMRRRSISASSRMNHGTYSAKCSLLSVGKYPKRL